MMSRYRHDRGVGERRDRAEVVPDHEAEDGQDQDRRGEVARHDIDDPLDRHPRRLGVTDHPDDCRQRGIGADLRRPEAEGAGLVEGRPDDLVTLAPLDRDRLAGDHRLVDSRGALDDDPVDGDPTARPHDHDISDDDLVDQDLDLHAVPDDAGRLGRQADELLDRLTRPAAGLDLHRHAEDDQGGNDDRDVVVDIGHVGRREHREQSAIAERLVSWS
jgi:hypothetical protein